MFICIICKIHREPCLDSKKKHIAPLKLVPDLPLQGLPKSFASCALVPSALQGLPKKLCYIQNSIVNFNGEGLRCFLVHNAQETPECLEPSFLFGTISLNFFQPAVLCWSWVSFCENFSWENW